MIILDAPIRVQDPSEIDLKKLIPYLQERIEGLDEKAELFKFPSGHSNLTYMIKCGDLELVLKRPPPGNKAKSAHDMGREYHVLSKLYGKFEYSPQPFIYCEDETLVGFKFCVVERINGVIIRGQYPADSDITIDTIRGQFSGLINALAKLHSLDVDAVGLGDFGRPIGYRSRQLSGWVKRLHGAQTDKMPNFLPTVEWLERSMPDESELSAIVHNDFKLDNLVWQKDDITKLLSVLDWEMSTVGDPLLDLACTISFWVQENDPAEFRHMRAMPSAHAGMFTRSQALELYSRQTGRKIVRPDFYLCFGYFRRAVIEQQKYYRYRTGQTQDARFADLDVSVRVLLGMCESVIKGQVQ
jgi:aminoglycoside phosphotransferase (APT) family kinase protein